MDKLLQNWLGSRERSRSETGTKKKEFKIMKKLSLTLSIMLFGVLAVSQSTTAATILQESALVSDYEGDSSQPHGPNSEWKYHYVSSGSVDDTSKWEEMSYNSDKWTGSGSNPSEYDATLDGSEGALRSRSHDAAIVTWEAAASGTAEFYLAGGKWYDDSSSYTVSFRDPDLNEIASFTDNFADTISDVTVQQGDTYSFIVTSSSPSQGWGMTDDSTPWDSWNPPADNQDGVQVTVIPEPSSALLLLFGGSMLLFRGRRRRQ